MIVGSMTFAENMLNVKSELESAGHIVNVPCDTEEHVTNTDLIDDLDKDLEHLMEHNILRKCFDLVAESDAILVLNYTKNGIDGYIGTSTLMETALAFYLKTYYV